MQSALKDFFENGGAGTDVIRMVEMMQRDSMALPDIIEEGAPGVGNGGTAKNHDPMGKIDTPMVDDTEIVMRGVMEQVNDDESCTL